MFNILKMKHELCLIISVHPLAKNVGVIFNNTHDKTGRLTKVKTINYCPQRFLSDVLIDSWALPVPINLVSTLLLLLLYLQFYHRGRFNSYLVVILQNLRNIYPSATFTMIILFNNNNIQLLHDHVRQRPCFKISLTAQSALRFQH